MKGMVFFPYQPTICGDPQWLWTRPVIVSRFFFPFFWGEIRFLRNGGMDDVGRSLGRKNQGDLGLINTWRMQIPRLSAEVS